MTISSRARTHAHTEIRCRACSATGATLRVTPDCRGHVERTARTVGVRS